MFTCGFDSARNQSFLNRVLLVAGFLSGLSYAPACANSQPDLEAHPDSSVWSFSTSTMGTFATLSLAGPDSLVAADLAYPALLRLHEADSLLSNWTKDSEIARVNREAGSGWAHLEPQLLTILSTAQTVSQQSEGAFDPSIEPLVRCWGFLGGTPHLPPENEIESARQWVGWQHVQLQEEESRIRFDGTGVRLDLGGIAKGFGVDRSAALLDTLGAKNYILNLSGNILARGAPPGRAAWRIGVRDPRDELPNLGSLSVRDAALATSGDYEQFVSANGKRYGHILDPRTGWPVEGMASVTVLAPSAMLADAWATAFFVLGAERARLIASRRDDLSCILVQRDQGQNIVVWIEKSLRSIYTPHPDSTKSVTLHWF
jgi:thiamine biosynthesis lipoprotein